MSEQYTEKEKIIALELAVEFWSNTNQNSNTKPCNVDTVMNTANQFYHWLINFS